MIIALIYLFLYAIIFLLAIVSYVFTAISLQTIAKRREIPNPWLAWIPIADSYLLGAIADDFDSRVGISKNYRKKLLTTGISGLAIFFINYIAYCVALVFAIVLTAENEELGMIILFLTSIIFLAVFVVSMVLIIIYDIYYYISLFKLFHSTAGDMVILPFILSLLVRYALPVCLFIWRNKDWDAMPAKVKNEGFES